MNTIVAKTTYELHREGVFDAVIAGLDAREGEFGPQFMFRLETGEIGSTGQELAVFLFTSQKLTPKSKLAGFIMDVMGWRYDQIPDSFDAKDLVGQRVRIVVKHKPDTKGELRAVISGILRLDVEEDDNAKDVNVDDDGDLADDIPF